MTLFGNSTGDSSGDPHCRKTGCSFGANMARALPRVIASFRRRVRVQRRVNSEGEREQERKRRDEQSLVREHRARAPGVAGLRGAIGRIATGGGSAALRIAHTPPRRCTYVENPLNRGLQPSPLLPLLTLLSSVLFSPSPRRDVPDAFTLLPLAALAFCSFFLILRPRSARALSVFSPPSTLFLLLMCVF